MTALMLAQTDSTGQKVTLIVFGLVAVAAALALLTAWYWRVTDPVPRNGASGGRGGRRRRTASEPSPDLGGGSKSSPTLATTTSNRPEFADDKTRLFERSEILDPTAPSDPPAPSVSHPQPEVIDLRADAPAGDPDQARTAEEVTGEIQLGGTKQPTSDRRQNLSHDPVLDLDSIDAKAPGSAGAHDDGIDFDDWLALADEEP
jgi:hypothetical protein